MMVKMTFRISKEKNSDTEGVENSNLVQKSGAEDDIVHAEVEVENAAIRNSEKE